MLIYYYKNEVTNTLLPKCASEQGNVIGLVSIYVFVRKIVIERTRDLIFVETHFFPKRFSPSAGETPVIQCSPCYSAVSALLKNTLPDHSNYSPLLVEAS